MDELSAAWKDMTDVQQAELSKIAAGQMGMQGFSALMTNFQDARDSIIAFESSSGDAMNKFDKMSDSIAFKSKQLSAEFQKMATSVLNSSIPKGLTDLTSGFLKLLNIADGLPAKITAITVALAGLNTAMKSSIGTKIAGTFTGLLKPKELGSRFLGLLGHPSCFGQWVLATCELSADVKIG